MHRSSLGPGREFDLIRQFLQRTSDDGELTIGPGDDCAVLQGGVAVSTDASVEGVHFRRDWLTAAEIGYRAAAAALSDLAAVAADPRALLVSLVLPRSDYGKFALDLMTGVQRAAQSVGAALAGGDTTSTDGPLVLDVIVIGHATEPILRSGARPGDHVFVTGELGGAAAALAAWQSGNRPEAEARRRFAMPAPRIREALWLAQRIALHAMIDLSDGLAADAAHLAAASRCALTIFAAQVPFQGEAGADVQMALSGGDDYELCFTADRSAVEEVALQFFDTFGVTITDVGEVTTGGGLFILDAEGKPVKLTRRGWDHFGGNP